MGAVADIIAQKLQIAFAPVTLEVIDDSAKHAGHGGARPGGETHFTVKLVSDAFEGVGQVARQRRVYAVLAEELRPDGVHALALATHTPAEAATTSPSLA